MIARFALCLAGFVALRAFGAPVLLDDRFELPPGFHISRVAGPDLAGGSYDLCFDGQGRLLVGDGTAIRRLSDRDGDGVYDAHEVVATGLGPRGPQGILVYGDRLFAVGGDGIQLFEGYRSGGPLKHAGRIGRKLNTGGDHDAHTLLRGHDGCLYFMAGNGSGLRDRLHITESNSPALFEREASVFRISPDGQRWECLASGGRNPPNLGVNFLGDCFSFDSDMEWHVAVPWYRPVRLNHWAIGGDQGWHDVGALPPYYLDNVPGILDVGRGSPAWGVFYEHHQFPERYRDAFVVCDYPWKSESTGDYNTAGRLLVFFLQREGAGWKATMEVLARPKPNARDAAGKLINFALVDVEVAPDGSLLLSDHNQGVWRLSYGAEADRSPRLASLTKALPPAVATTVAELISLPQPGSEWSRLREEALRASLGPEADRWLREAFGRGQLPLEQRLRVLRLLAPGFATMDADWVSVLAREPSPEVRAHAAWLLGLRGGEAAAPLLVQLLNDDDPFVRRRAAEALTRLPSPAVASALIPRLADPARLVRYVSMVALAHQSPADWLEAALAQGQPQIRMRALVATLLRREPPPDAVVRQAVRSLLDEYSPAVEDRLDLLRVVGLFRKSLEGHPASAEQAAEHLLKDFPHPHRDVRWEQVRLLGEFRVGRAFGPLLALLEAERDGVVQFHIAQALARLPAGWSEDEERQLVRWFLGTQRGWFAEFNGKGVEFPQFWATVLADFGAHHRAALLRETAAIDFAGQLGGVAADLVAAERHADEQLMALYRAQTAAAARARILRGFTKVTTPAAGEFLRREYTRVNQPSERGPILLALAAQPPHAANLPPLLEGLRHPDPDVVRASARALAPLKPGLTEELARLLLTRLTERRDWFQPVEKLLLAISRVRRPGSQADTEANRAPEEPARAAAIAFWKDWYARQFQKPFEPLAAGVTEKSDEQLHRFLLGDALAGGNAKRGGKVYEILQCHTCHGGGLTPGNPGKLFGPDLSGVTRRLSRQELAEALVYPSRQVADRFKAYEVELKDGEPLTGFLTEQTEDSVTLVDRDQVHRLARGRIETLRLQATSLMPEHLLNRLSWEEIRDLYAFLDEGLAVKAAGPAVGR